MKIITGQDLFDAYKAGVANAGVEIEETWETLEDYDRAGWIHASRYVSESNHADPRVMDYAETLKRPGVCYQCAHDNHEACYGDGNAVTCECGKRGHGERADG